MRKSCNLVSGHSRPGLHADRMAALGTLVAGVVHELSNPITVIAGYAGTMKAKLDRASDEWSMADCIHQQSLRCRDLVRELLCFSRRDDAARRVPADLGRLVSTCARLMKAQYADAHVELMVEIEDGLPSARLQPERWMQAVLNLLVNALHAAGDAANAMRGQVKVGLRRGPRGLRLTVEDNGPGIPPAHMNRIFEAFFTTKPPGQGTGLGLSITRQIVEEDGGAITVSNAPGGGAAFVVDVPVFGEGTVGGGCSPEPRDPAVTPYDCSRRSIA